MPEFAPFADDTTALTIGGLTVENGPERISISGSLDIARDEQGREQVAALKAVVEAVDAALHGGASPQARPRSSAVRSTRKNPFA